MVAGEKGKNWHVFDSYDETDGDFIKELDWNYDFGFSKGFFITEITENTQECRLVNLAKLLCPKH